MWPIVHSFKLSMWARGMAARGAAGACRGSVGTQTAGAGWQPGRAVNGRRWSSAHPGSHFPLLPPGWP